jgi:hypothetical protein
MRKYQIIVIAFMMVSYAGAAELLWYLPYDANMNDGVNGEAPTQVNANSLADEPYASTSPSLSAGLTSGGSGAETGGALDMRDTMAIMGQASYGGWVRYGSPDYDSAMEQSMMGLSSFTVMGWLNTKDSSIAIGNNARVFASSDNSFSLLFNNGSVPGRMQFALEGNWYNSGYAVTNWGLADEWVFFAASYDGTTSTENLKYYIGGLDTNDVELVVTLDSNVGTFNYSGNWFVVGNNGADNTSADKGFKGLIDELRMFGSAADASGALDAADITLYKNDVFTAVPEPATIGLLAIGGLAFVRRKK